MVFMTFVATATTKPHQLPPQPVTRWTGPDPIQAQPTCPISLGKPSQRERPSGNALHEAVVTRKGPETPKKKKIA